MGKLIIVLIDQHVLRKRKTAVIYAPRADAVQRPGHGARERVKGLLEFSDNTTQFKTL